MQMSTSCAVESGSSSSKPQGLLDPLGAVQLRQQGENVLDDAIGVCRLDNQAPKGARGRCREEVAIAVVVTAANLCEGAEDEIIVLVVRRVVLGVRQGLIGLLQLVEALRGIRVITVLVRDADAEIHHDM